MKSGSPKHISFSLKARRGGVSFETRLDTYDKDITWFSLGKTISWVLEEPSCEVDMDGECREGCGFIVLVFLGEVKRVFLRKKIELKKYFFSWKLFF